MIEMVAGLVVAVLDYTRRTTVVRETENVILVDQMPIGVVLGR